MSGQQVNAWQTARPRQTQLTSRSGTASPQPSSLQAPRQDRSGPAQNVWTQRTSQSGERSSANSSARQQSPTTASTSDYTPANGFNSVEVKAFLSRGVSTAVYKPTEAAGTRAGGAWNAKTTHTASGQSFFGGLAKQVAGLENGG